MNKIHFAIFGGIAVVVVLAILVILGVIPGLKEREGPPFTLEVWGFEDEPELWQELAQKYREELKSATINYTKIEPKEYETRLINALAAGSGPDIFLLKDEWLKKHSDKIKPLAEENLGYQKRQIESEFADSLIQAIVSPKNELLGIPLAFDTLALFYNRDYFNSENIASPPKTWDELADLSQRLTRRTPIGAILRSGIALGRASNVEYAPDIFMVLLLQSGGKIIDEQKKQSLLDQPATGEVLAPAVSALSYINSFSDSRKKTYSWGSFFENSLDEFSKGDLAMAFGYAKDVPKIRAKNPQLNFGLSSLPQPKDAMAKINFGRFNLWVVSRHSQNSEQAWKFLRWLEEKDQQKFYSDAKLLPPSRRDLINSKPPTEYLAVFYAQVLSAKTIPISGGEFIPKAIGDMIDSVSNRTLEINEAIRRADQEINDYLRGQ